MITLDIPKSSMHPIAIAVKKAEAILELEKAFAEAIKLRQETEKKAREN